MGSGCLLCNYVLDVGSCANPQKDAEGIGSLLVVAMAYGAYVIICLEP